MYGSTYLYGLPEVLLGSRRKLVIHDEAARPLEKPSGPYTMTQHAENASSLAVRDRVEALQNARDVSVVLLHHRVASLLRIRLCMRDDDENMLLGGWVDWEKEGQAAQVSNKSVVAGQECFKGWKWKGRHTRLLCVFFRV